ncbi:unnamed protein product [Bursaphelenchus xylophilus]|uniref:(pine wood nematode) hypothetical protein n=1 Tax=Bursaphelenchus xylophilus TaxID=6326 RepID=A0A1I7RWW9_BURXY|nr:unnamed protein product [Bursaphelenchus xylophilus]CAG9121171.1 unnamed protein product [Bursaphelenchus xylophilus]
MRSSPHRPRRNHRGGPALYNMFQEFYPFNFDMTVAPPDRLVHLDFKEKMSAEEGLDPLLQLVELRRPILQDSVNPLPLLFSFIRLLLYNIND